MSDKLIDFKAAKHKLERKQFEEFRKKVYKLKSQWEYKPPTSITAVLETRDGATQTIAIPYPPSPRYLMPLSTRHTFLSTQSEVVRPTQKDIRTYRFEGYKDGIGETILAYYREI